MLENNKYKAIIFDLDGVLCATDHYHYLAWKAIADVEGIYFDEKINNRLRGVSRLDSLDIILEKSSRKYSNEEKEELAYKKNEIYKSFLEFLSPGDLCPNVSDTLAFLYGKYRLAIGSSSRNTMLIVNKLCIRKYFDVIVDGNMISKSKPDPEVYLKCAELLGLPPSSCLVVEDAPSGIIAAVRGGFDTAAIGEARESNDVSYKLDSISDLLKYL